MKQLHEWVTSKLSNGPRRWQDLTEELREELWLAKHLNEVIRLMRRNGEIVGEEFDGKFSLKNNLLLRLVEESKSE